MRSHTPQCPQTAADARHTPVTRRKRATGHTRPQTAAGKRQRALRGYQREAVESIRAAWSGGHRAVMYQLATGGGKTAVAATLSSGLRALMVAPTLSVIEQAPAEFAKWGGCAMTAVGSGKGMVGWNEVRTDGIVCSHIAAVRRLDQLADRFDLVVIDEAHHAFDHPRRPDNSFTRIVKAAVDAGLPVVGFTATPWVLDKLAGFTGAWDTLRLGGNWADLRKPRADEDYLAKPVVEAVGSSGKPAIVGKGRAASGDYAVQDTFAVNRANPLFIERLLDYCPSDSPALIYAIGQDHAVEIARNAAMRGMRIGLLVSGKGKIDALVEELDDIADKVVIDPVAVRDGLRDGSLLAAVNVNMVTEGFDCPSVSTIVVARPTQSVALHRQILGRGSRLTPDQPITRIVDLTDNWKRLGHPLDDCKWTLEPRKTANGEADPPERICWHSDCDMPMPPAQHICSWCEQPQGAECPRCGKWRFNSRWHCGLPKQDIDALEGTRLPMCAQCMAAERWDGGALIASVSRTSARLDLRLQAGGRLEVDKDTPKGGLSAYADVLAGGWAAVAFTDAEGAVASIGAIQTSDWSLRSVVPLGKAVLPDLPSGAPAFIERRSTANGKPYWRVVFDCGRSANCFAWQGEPYYRIADVIRGVVEIADLRIHTRASGRWVNVDSVEIASAATAAA